MSYCNAGQVLSDITKMLKILRTNEKEILAIKIQEQLLSWKFLIHY